MNDKTVFLVEMYCLVLIEIKDHLIVNLCQVNH